MSRPRTVRKLLFELLGLKYAELVDEQSASIPAGGTGAVDISPPSGYDAVITLTNHLNSGDNISLTSIAYFDGTTETPLKDSHLSSGESILVKEGHSLRANFSNAGTAAETAYFRGFGKLIRK